MPFRFAFVYFLFVFPFFLTGQNTFFIEKTLNWKAEPLRRVVPATGAVVEIWQFEGGQFTDKFRHVTVFTQRFPVPAHSTLKAHLVAADWEGFDKKPAPDDDFLSPEPAPDVWVEQERHQFFGWLTFVPVRRVGHARFERARSFTVQIEIVPSPADVAVTERGGTYTSVLSDGTIYKFGVAQSGVYKLDFNFLKNELKISNLESIDPRTIKIYGNGGGMLPERTNSPRIDDLLENAIEIVGEADGKFDPSDYILLYSNGPNPVVHRPSDTDPELVVRTHLYDTHAYFFLKISAVAGKRIANRNEADATNARTTNEFDDVRRFEQERVNLLHFNNSTQGSGKRFFGDYFLQTQSKDYSNEFNFGSGVITTKPARVRMEFAGRSALPQTVTLSVDGVTFTRTINPVLVSDNEGIYASGVTAAGTFIPKGNTIQVRIDYPLLAVQREGWLDYIEINLRRRLQFSGTSFEFRDLESRKNDVTNFELSTNDTDIDIWDVTEWGNAVRQQYSVLTGKVSFAVATKDVLRTFVVFKKSGSLNKPEKIVGKLDNQNIHQLDNLHYAIVYHPDFELAAQRLLEHRRDFSQLNAAKVRIDQLYNEFSGGQKDPTAIRDFARLLFQRNSKFDYLLLLGDGSFDPKNNTRSAENLDFVPVFETAESFSPITAHPSDDYFGLLSDGEDGALRGALEIAVGRIPCNSPNEATAVVDKIIEYDKSPQSLGDWHLRLLYLADDEDGNAHIDQADRLSTAAEKTEAWFNSEKIYFDAYQQVSTSAGQRFPDAKAAINNAIFKGALLTQYIGHGGPRGWAQERVIDNSDIASWDNPHRYTFIITATCTFGGYDDPFTVSGGEQSLLKIRSGAVGLFTTVRPVYISDNNILTDAIQKVIFERKNGWYRTVGDILKDGKNQLFGGSENNARRFTLLGDPAMFLALPEHRVVTTRINGKPVKAGIPTDTIRALQPVKIEGIVTDTLGNWLSSFNGNIFVTVFDKSQNIQTLAQDPGSRLKNFTVRRNILFRGKASVKNGSFAIEFIVPKDINYDFGVGKISYYAENGTPFDAAGADFDFVVGGISQQIQDDQPPIIQVFMNTDNFALGGITNAHPKILVKCTDDHGMNVTGTSLGHDLVAVLDDNVQETIILNDFYESEQNNFRKGTAIYPLRNLAPGRHTVRVKGWDIANNSGEGYTEFVVAEDGKMALEHVFNYPNPFTTSTYFAFEHNFVGQMLDVQISIFTVSGRLVKTIVQNLPAAEGFRVSNIHWDGRDDFGDPLAKGVYLYRVKVRGTDVSGKKTTVESDFEKLVILK